VDELACGGGHGWVVACWADSTSRAAVEERYRDPVRLTRILGAACMGAALDDLPRIPAALQAGLQLVGGVAAVDSAGPLAESLSEAVQTLAGHAPGASDPMRVLSQLTPIAFADLPLSRLLKSWFRVTSPVRAPVVHAAGSQLPLKGAARAFAQYARQGRPVAPVVFDEGDWPSCGKCRFHLPRGLRSQLLQDPPPILVCDGCGALLYHGAIDHPLARVLCALNSDDEALP